MTPAEEKRVAELTEEIHIMKKLLTAKFKYMTNRAVNEGLQKIGELLSEKNALTGLQEDAPYLYLSDGERIQAIEGFIGDESGMRDYAGNKLKIGDTISINGHPRIVMKDMPSQQTILECKSLKIKDCSDMDICDASACSFNITLRSCLEDYEQSFVKGMEMNL